MKTCKKSFLVLILAFILCFNTLTFTASADSITGSSYRDSVPAFGLGGYALTFASAPISETHGRSINRITFDDAYYLDGFYDGSINGHTWYANGGNVPLFGWASLDYDEEPYNVIDFAFRGQQGYYLYDYPSDEFLSDSIFTSTAAPYPFFSLTRSNFYINFTLFERFWNGDNFQFLKYSGNFIHFYHHITFLDEYGLLATVEGPLGDAFFSSFPSGLDYMPLHFSMEDILDYNPVDAYGNIYIVEHTICGYTDLFTAGDETPYGDFMFRYNQLDLLTMYGNQRNSIYIGNLNNSYLQSASLRFTDNSFSPFGWFGDIMSVEIFPGFPLYYTMLVAFGAIMFGYLIKIFLGG